MAVLTLAQARKFVRQPAVWVSPSAYIASAANKANVISQAREMHEKRAWPQDVIAPALQDPALPGPIAVAYNQDAVAAVADTPYQPAVAGEAARAISTKSIVVGCEVPLNYLALNNDDGDRRFARAGNQSTPYRTEMMALMIEAFGEWERQCFVGDSIAFPDEFSGYLAGDFPHQTLATGPDLLRSINEACDLVNCGRGVSKCDVIFGHQRAGRAIAALLTAAGITPPQVRVEKLRRNLMAVPTAQGWIPFVPSNFLPVQATELTSLVMACLEGENAVHMAVPEEVPDIRATTVRIDDKPAEMLILELKSCLLNNTNGTAVELTGFGPV